MNVLSLFDGMSCGQIAIKELGISVDNYFASEVDKFAIAQTKLNFPDTVHLGDVRNVNVKDLPKIDLLIGGSPCQSFSFAGKRKGMTTVENEDVYTLERYLELKNAGFEFEGQSYLFWEYMRILGDLQKINPDILFLLENVEMGQKWESVLSKAIGVYGVHINSALVSAQNRKRIYWTNIRTKVKNLLGELESDIPQPKDRGLYLKDILEDFVDEKYYLSDKSVWALLTHAERNREKGYGFGAVFHKPDMKMSCLRVGGKSVYDLVCMAMRGRESIEEKEQRKNIQQLEPRTDGKTNTLTSVQKDNLIIQLGRGANKGGMFKDKSPTLTSNSWEHNNFVRSVRQLNPDKSSNGRQLYQTDRVYDINGISPALTAQLSPPGNKILIQDRIRILTPTECARLQTVPDWYKWQCSETQQYKMLGNGWTIEVIKHILSFMKNEDE